LKLKAIVKKGGGVQAGPICMFLADRTEIILW